MEMLFALVLSGIALLSGGVVARAANPCESYLGFYIAGGSLIVIAPAALALSALIKRIQISSRKGGAGRTEVGYPVRAMSEYRKAVVNMRNAAAIVFLGLLVGIAFQNASDPAWHVLDTRGITLVDGALFLAFFVLGLGTFLFGYYNLAASGFDGLQWFAAFAILVLECVILIFMGHVVTADTTRAAKVGLPYLLFAFLVIDAVWNCVTLLIVWNHKDKVANHKTARQLAQPFTYLALASAGTCGIMVLSPLFPTKNGNSQLVALSGLVVVAFAVQIGVAAKQELL